jgi:hypothetical protein
MTLYILHSLPCVYASGDSRCVHTGFSCDTSRQFTDEGSSSEQSSPASFCLHFEIFYQLHSSSSIRSEASSKY